MKQVYSYQEFKTLQSLPFDDKMWRARQLVCSELKSAERPMVACSFGKDSMVLLHLVRTFCKNAVVCFHNTLCQYPETYAYRDLILEEWDIVNYVETRPIKSFWECAKEYGFPKFRQMGRGRKGQKGGKYRTPKCCYYLKEGPAKRFIRKNKIDLEFLGLQASESMVRRLSFLREGEVFDSKTYGCRIVRPLMIWMDDDIWNYHSRFEIPKNPLYDKMDRNGCMPCTGFRTWREQLARTNPRMYSYISTKMGQPLLDQFMKVPCEDVYSLIRTENRDI